MSVNNGPKVIPRTGRFTGNNATCETKTEELEAERFPVEERGGYGKKINK